MEHNGTNSIQYHLIFQFLISPNLGRGLKCYYSTLILFASSSTKYLFSIHFFSIFFFYGVCSLYSFFSFFSLFTLTVDLLSFFRLCSHCNITVLTYVYPWVSIYINANKKWHIYMIKIYSKKGRIGIKIYNSFHSVRFPNNGIINWFRSAIK